MTEITYIDTLLAWNDISWIKLIAWSLILLILFKIIFTKKSKFTEESKFLKSINYFLNNYCFINCKEDICKNVTKFSRGGTYLLSSDCMDHTECLFTVWEASHLLLHIGMGYSLNAYFSVAIGIIFEIFEYYVYDCASILDIFWNTLGMLIGVYIRYYFAKKREKEIKV